MKNKTKTILLTSISLGVAIPIVATISIAAYQNREDNRSMLERIQISKDLTSNDQFTINKPFRKLEFKSENKVQELKEFIKNNLIENYYIVPYEVDFELAEYIQKGKNFDSLINDKKYIWLWYLPKKIKDITEKSYQFDHFFIKPYTDIEDFIVPSNDYTHKQYFSGDDNLSDYEYRPLLHFSILESHKMGETTINNKTAKYMDTLDLLRHGSIKSGYRITLNIYKSYLKNDNFTKEEMQKLPSPKEILGVDIVDLITD